MALAALQTPLIVSAKITYQIIQIISHMLWLHAINFFSFSIYLFFFFFLTSYATCKIFFSLYCALLKLFLSQPTKEQIGRAHV